MSSKLAAIQVTVDSKVLRSISNIVSDTQAALEAIYPHIVDDIGIAAYKKAVADLEQRTREHIAALFDEATGGKREVVEFPYTEHTEFRAFVVRRQTFAPTVTILYGVNPAEVQSIMDRAYGGSGDTWIYDTRHGQKYHRMNDGKWIVADIKE